jgi:flap endonuclease-1
MGIKNLNRFIANNAPSAIKKIHLSSLEGKSICIDASIYMYRFQSDNRLLEHFYILVSIFRQYNICPIFVFDGKAPDEKKELLKERREKKQRAEADFQAYAEQLQQTEDAAERAELENEMLKLKKQFIKIRDSDIKAVQQLLTLYGAPWVCAVGEADALCAQLMYKRRVYACMSEDMDMFVYGCGRVIRHISLLKHTVLLYDLHDILTQLNMNLMEFKDILVISGTDYNKDDSTNLYDSMKWFQKYKKMTLTSMDGVPSFYEWLLQNTKYIKNMDMLMSTHALFDIRKDLDNAFIDGLRIHYADIEKNGLQDFMREDGFVF